MMTMTWHFSEGAIFQEWQGGDYDDDDDNDDDADRSAKEKRSSKRNKKESSSTVDPALVEDQAKAPSDQNHHDHIQNYQENR